MASQLNPETAAAAVPVRVGTENREEHMQRSAEIERNTRETQIRISVTIDGAGKSDVSTGIPFMDHMLTLFARHGFFDLHVKASGDLEVDAHHTIEDLGIVLGKAIAEALGDKRGIRRYGHFALPMDDALTMIALDLSGRPFLAYNVTLPVDYINGTDVRLFHEFFLALTNNLALNLHIDLVRGNEVHHILESIFKCFAKALDMATTVDPREAGIPSTKGLLD